MGEPSGGGKWLQEPLGDPQPSGVPEPLGDPQPLDVPEPLGDPQPSGVPELLRDPQPSGVPEPLGDPQPLDVPEPLDILGPLEVLQPPGDPQPSGVLRRVGVLQATPPAELMEDVLRGHFGPLPQWVPIIRMRRGPHGGYEPTGDLAEVLERRQVANAKERERIRNLNNGFSQLRALVPLVPQDHRPSKAEILRAAAEYIQLLQGVLKDCEQAKAKAKQESGDSGGAPPEGPPETCPGSPRPEGAPRVPPCPGAPQERGETDFPATPKNTGVATGDAP